MPPLRLPKERIDSLVDRISGQIAKVPGITVSNPAELRAIVRAALVADIQAEYDLEQEVIKTLQAHGQKIYEQNADFQKMLQEGKKILAKQRGFTL